MEMKKNILFLAACALALFSCSKIQPEVQVEENSTEPEYITIRLVNEVQDATKAYYLEESDYWTYSWEDQDDFNYFYYSRANLLGNSTAPVLKSPEATFLSYKASDLAVGNTIYSYFAQKDVSGKAIVNNDPSKVKMIIPGTQVSTLEPETFRTEIDCAIVLSELGVETDHAEGDAGFLNLGNVSIPDNTLVFKIDNYNPAYTYTCTKTGSNGDVKSFSVDANGLASAVLSFADYDTGVSTQSTSVKVSTTNYADNYATITVTATRKGTKGTAPEGRISYYAAEETGNVAVAHYNTSKGAEMPYPVRNAMPCASKGKVVTSTLLEYPEDIANSMTMYLLGSVAEFRIYSSTGEHAGEQIQKCVLTADKPCAGNCSYDIASESLELSGFDQNSITSNVAACGHSVPAVKGNEESIYMVIAPGTYDFEFKVVTKDGQGKLWQYCYSLTEKTFTRAMRKPFSVNLESGSATRAAYTE